MTRLAWPIDNLNQLYALSELPWPNWLTYTVYQPLVFANETAEYGNGNIQYLPGLASRWTVSPDGKTYTFNLRQGIKFSNGDSFNAYKVWAEMYGFYYLSGNGSTWMESYDFFNMTNVNFGPSTIRDADIERPEQPHLPGPDHDGEPELAHLRHELEPDRLPPPEPVPVVPGALVVYDGLMYDVNYLLQNGGFGTPTQFNQNFNLSPIPGTGPYVVTGESDNAYVSFTQSSSYWGTP